MLEKIKNMRITMKLVSVVLAIIIWLMLIYTVDPVITQVIQNVSVTFYGEDELAQKGLVLVNKDDTDKVSVKVRGARSSVIEALSVVGAYVNVSDITEAGTWRKTVNYNLGVAGVSVDGRTNDIISVQVDELVEKNVPVRIKQTGADKNKEIIIESVAEYDTLKVRGAKSELEKMTEIVVTTDISETTENDNSLCEYHIADGNGSEIELHTLTDMPEKINVENRVYKKKSLDVSFLLSKNRDKYMVDVKSASKDKIDVGIIGDDTATVSRITYLFNPDSYTDAEREYEVSAEIPEGIFIPEESRTLKAKLELKELVRSDITLDVEVRNAPVGTTVTTRPETVTVTVRAPQGTAEKIKAYVDVGGLGEGSYELEVKTENDKDVIFEETAHIWATIKGQRG